jgi:hypothetical protein
VLLSAVTSVAGWLPCIVVGPLGLLAGEWTGCRPLSASVSPLGCRAIASEVKVSPALNLVLLSRTLFLVLQRAPWLLLIVLATAYPHLHP